MHYENNWESLNSRHVPDWFADAKFGIFIHWGLYSVPAYTEKGQYAEWYMQQIRDENSAARKFHDRVYAPGTQYEDFVSGFKAELFDADEWAQLFEKSGAKYINSSRSTTTASACSRTTMHGTGTASMSAPTGTFAAS